MGQSDDVPGTQQLGYEAWRNIVREMGGRFNPEGIEPNAFTGWVRPVSVCGFTAAEVSSNAQRVERTYRDVRLDRADHYFVLFPIAGRSALTHNDQTVRLDVGDAVLVDVAKPATFAVYNNGEHWESVALLLPRQSLVAHLGFEPGGGLCRSGRTAAGRLLFDLIRDADPGEGSVSSPSDSYMKWVVYDLVGALFAPSEPWAVSRHADKLFARMHGIIEGRFTDPDFDPCELAAEAGISVRYVQKLFTQRGSTFSQFVYSLRLDHAACLLHRRASLGASQPLSEIAYACGFRDYTHFARKFRHRFGCAPGAMAGRDVVCVL